jgi:glutamate--cysteine ligase
VTTAPDTRVDRPVDISPAVLRDRAEAERYVASICFKHGPPRRLGVELEWIVHHEDDPARRLDATQLGQALGPHAPQTLLPESPWLPLPGGSQITVEPGGQVEISSAPADSLAELVALVSADAALLTQLLRTQGLVLGSAGIDRFREPQRLLDTPRYAAMEAAFAPIGPDGIAMMCATAGLQVCLDAGEADRVATRWAAVHALGPVCIALFANSAARRGPCFTWASARTRTLLGVDPPRMRPAPVTADPAAGWARHALDTSVICVRRPDAGWEPARPMTFAEWIEHPGAEPPPTTEDLDYHLSTMFPPVRPRGYLEVRYLDTQVGDDWIAPTTLLAALFADESGVDAALAAARPAAGRWLHAARYGLSDARVARAARAVVGLGIERLGGGMPALGVSREQGESIATQLDERITNWAGGEWP